MKSNKKQVKRCPPKKNFYLYIANYILTHKKLPCEHILGMSKQNRNYYIKQLKIDEIIYRKGYGVWIADKDKVEQLNFLKQVKTTPPHTKTPKNIKYLKKSHDIRGHGYTITVEIPERFKKTEILKQVKRCWGGRYINNNKTITTIINDRKVWFSLKSIVVYFKKEESFYGESANDCERSAIYTLKAIISHIERTLSISLRIKKGYKYNVSRSHYANLNNELAKDFNNRSKKLQIFYNGKCWLLIDRSFNVDELELIGNRSKSDCDNVVMPFFNDLKGHYDKTGETYTMSEVVGIIKAMAIQNKETATGLNAVVKLMQVPQEIGGLDKWQTELRQYTG